MVDAALLWTGSKLEPGLNLAQCHWPSQSLVPMCEWINYYESYLGGTSALVQERDAEVSSWNLTFKTGIMEGIRLYTSWSEITTNVFIRLIIKEKEKERSLIKPRKGVS